MKTLHQQIACHCKHFNGLQNSACDAGVQYDSVKDESRKGFGRWPCWREGEELTCEKRKFLTPEEVEAEVQEIEAATIRLTKGMVACREDAKQRGLKKGNGGTGKIKCPVCDNGTLHYSVAGYNGHMHARCSTEHCLSWMQ